MKKLYESISIDKRIQQCNEQICESINYYKLKNNKYGIEIEKKNENKEIEKTNVIDITDDEEKINNILNLLVCKQVMPSSEDIIEDLVKQYK